MAFHLTRLTLHDPSVVINGTTATLTAYREKRDGSTEEYSIRFEELDAWELACIGRSVVRALRTLRINQDAQMQRAITDVTGWKEPDTMRTP
jgi:hypothetical protein